MAGKVKRILPDNRTIILDMQKRVFRIACDPRRYGLTLNIIATDSGIGYDSLRNYAAGKTEMPLSALYALGDVLDDKLLTLLQPEGKQLVTVPDGIDFDDFSQHCRNFEAIKAAAHHPDSPAGRDISDCERAKLTTAAAPLKVA